MFFLSLLQFFGGFFVEKESGILAGKKEKWSMA